MKKRKQPKPPANNDWQCVLINVESSELNEYMKRIRDSRYEYRYQKCSNGNMNVYCRKYNSNPITFELYKYLKKTILPNLDYMNKLLVKYGEKNNINLITDDTTLLEICQLHYFLEKSIKKRIEQLEKEGYKL